MTEQLGPAPDVKLADVKWRVDSEPKNGKARFIPYIDVYIAASLLDEWVGVGNWKDHYLPAPHGKGLMCQLSVKVGDEWVTKEDVGVASNTEPEKGTVSDAFKRVASLKWGIARNVYRLPNIYAVCDERQGPKGVKAYPNDKTEADIIRQLKAKGFTDAATAGAEAKDESVPCPVCGDGQEDKDAAREHLVTAHKWVRREDGTVVKPELEEVA
jgi:hypothetical protein